MLAQRSVDQVIIGIDPHIGSFESTAWNFNQSRWSDRMQAFQMDLDSFVNRSKPDSFQCIVTNPPYFNQGVLPTGEKSRYAKHMGILDEEKLAECTALLLARRGTISLIYPPEQMTRFESYCFGLNLFPINKCHIHSTETGNVIRVMATFSFDLPVQIQEEKLIIYDRKKNYTEQYRSMLKEFLTIF
jgi:tRNA1Val (adenine37-N6)-methyltransferase